VIPEDADLADLLLTGATADPAESRAADALAVALARSVAASPPLELRARLLEQAAAEPRPFVKPAGDGTWEDWLPGLSRRILYADEANGRVTMLLRLAPGGRLPAHPHPGVEEVYILEGELYADDGRVLRPGDYQRSEGGSRHGEQWSVGGCTALLIGPLSA
jgi:anti-sigma factor ChrR (cupin superfamily)